MDAPLDLLEEYGYIRRESTGSAKGGRQSERIVLNPAVHHDKTDTTPDSPNSSVSSVGSVIVFPEPETNQTETDDHTDSHWGMTL